MIHLESSRERPPRLARAIRRISLGALIAWTSCALAQSDEALDEHRRLVAQQKVFRDVISRLKPSLVRIETVGGAQPPEALVEADDDDASNPLPVPPKNQNPFRDAPGSGFVVADGPTTGIIYSSDGYIITSSFNFVREPALVSAVMPDGSRRPAALIARDQVHKVALLKIDANDLVVPEWVDPKRVRVGQWAVALGLGFGGRDPAPSVGIVGAARRMRGYALQTDAKLSPANYGGPLVDIDGRILGMCVPMAQRPGELAGVEMYDSGVGFALTRDKIDAIVETLKTGENVYRGWLGMQVDPREPDQVRIFNLADPSPLRSAGAEVGDVILEINGEEILHYGHLFSRLALEPAGSKLALKLQRGDRALSLLVTLARNTELGDLPDLPEPFDPSHPQSRDEK